MFVQSFPPVARPDARVLILGSMPGAASLAAGEYYAHPRNAFWPILGSLFGFDPLLPYPARCEALRNAGVALWDVLRACERRGSADAAIRRATQEANDIAGFLRQHRGIRAVFLNGTKAEDCFRRFAAPSLQGFALRCERLPSTSPAHAGMSFERKLAAWRAVADSADHEEGRAGQRVRRDDRIARADAELVE